MTKLELEITVEGAERAAAAFEALALAANKAREAIEKLGDIRHGNLTVAMAGKVMHCEFKMPPDETIDLRMVDGTKKALRRIPGR